MPKKDSKGRKRKGFKDAAKALKSARRARVRERRWAEATEDEDLDAAEADEVRMSRASEDLTSQLGKKLAEGGGEEWLDPSRAEIPFGEVAGIRGRRCRVTFQGGTVDCLIPMDIAIFQRMALAVGDRVTISFEGDDPTISGVARRKSKLSRPDPHMPGMERVLVANIDLVVIVASAAKPPFNPGAVDRYLVAAQAGGATPVLVVNKLDLVKDWPEQADLYRGINMGVIGTSAETGLGIGELTEAIRDQLCAFVGHSGVGKSSLLNAIEPDLNIKTLDVREADGRGRHATTFSSLYELSCGARVVDTPGIREIGLWEMRAADLSFYFPDFRDLPPCRFRDCSHTHEPGCAVKAAVEAGDIPESRYESYLRILESLEE